MASPSSSTAAHQLVRDDMRCVRSAEVSLLTQVYDACLQVFRHRHAWIGFIDSDEFIVVKDPQLDLPTFLQARPRVRLVCTHGPKV